MGVSRPNPTQQSNIFERIGQHTTRYIVLALSVLSQPLLLGRRFYKLKPALMLTSLPIAALLILGNIWRQNNQDTLILKSYQLIQKKNIQPIDSQDHIIKLRLEKWLFLSIYFCSDTIASLEILQSIILSFLSRALFPIIKGFSFFIACFSALYIHTYCRLPDYEQTYDSLEYITSRLPIKRDLTPIITTIVTYLSLWASFTLLDATPLLSLALFSTSLTIILMNLKQLARIHTGIYLTFFVGHSARSFTRNLLKQLHSLRLISLSVPLLTRVADCGITSLVLLYTVAYNRSNERTHQLKNHLRENVGSPKQAHP